MDNFREVLNCDESTALEYFSNDNSIKIDIKWKLALKNITYEIEFRNSIQDWVFYHRLPVVKKCLEFPLVSEAIKEEWNMNTDCLSTGTLCWIIYNNGHKKCTRKL